MNQGVRTRSGSQPHSYELEALVKDGDEAPAPKTTKTPPLYVLMYILLWYAFSISLSVYNKWMFSSTGLDFAFPVLTTAGHQLVQAALAAATMRILNISIEKFTLRDYMYQVFPTTLASSGDIGLGNLSMRLVTLSFYTMVKSSALGFVLLFSVMFGLERANMRLVLIIGVLTAGVFMMVAGETQFNLMGFILVLSAACSSGLRWALTKLLLDGRFKSKPHPVQTILMLAPGMFVILLVFGLIVEGPVQFVNASLWTKHNIFVSLVFLTMPGILAYCMTWAEFQLLHVTGALTLAIAGICKEVATIIISVFIFHDRLTWVNGLGILVTIAAIAAYHQFRHVHPSNETLEEPAGPEATEFDIEDSLETGADPRLED